MPLQVYRHLLFNRLGRSDEKVDPSIVRLGVLLLLFDVYISWARVESSIAAGIIGPQVASNLTKTPILLQYMFFFTLNVLATTAHHMTVRLLVRIYQIIKNIETASPILEKGLMVASERQELRDVNGRLTEDKNLDTPAAVRPGCASASAISTALFVSSCMKLFPILLVIWPGPGSSDPTHNPATSNSKSSGLSFASRASNYVGWAILLNNIEALLILLNCGYVVATALAIAGAAARWAVEAVVLSAVGLGGGSGPIGDTLVTLGQTFAASSLSQNG